MAAEATPGFFEIVTGAILGPLIKPWLQLLDLVFLITPVVIVLILIGWFIQREGPRMLILSVIVVTLALTGAISGYAGGLSRVGVVGDLVPAILALLGGLVIHLFGVDLSRGLIASFATAALVAGFFLGYAHGAEKRAKLDFASDRKEICREVFATNGIYGSALSLRVLAEDFRDPCLTAFGLKQVP